MFERRASPAERKIDEVIMMLQMQNEALQAILNILQPPQPPIQYTPPPQPQPKEAEQNELPPIKPVDQPKPM